MVWSLWRKVRATVWIVATNISHHGEACCNIVENRCNIIMYCDETNNRGNTLLPCQILQWLATKMVPLQKEPNATNLGLLPQFFLLQYTGILVVIRDVPRGKFYSPKGDMSCSFWIVQYIWKRCFVDYYYLVCRKIVAQLPCRCNYSIC
jgi:hypothetical protein